LEESKVKEYEPIIDQSKVQLFIVEDQKDNSDYNETIKDVSRLIRDGNDRLQVQCKKGILLLGDTGAGKSTLAHLLSNRELKAIIEHESGDLLLDAVDPAPDIVIGHNMASETKVPNKCLGRNGTVIWDCPGFNDTDPVQEIANSFYIKRLFETTEEMRFVLVIPEPHLRISRGENFLATISSFMKVFSNIKTVAKDSIALVITQVPPHKKIINIANSIEKILNDNQSVTDEQRELVTYLAAMPALHLFYQPKEEGVFNADNLLREMERESCYIKTSPAMAGISVSPKALKCSELLLNSAKSNFNKILDVTVKAILDATSCMNNTQKNVLATNYSLVKDWIPDSIQYKVQDEKNEYFPQLDLLFRLQKELGSSAGSMPEGLEFLRRAFETIAKYAEYGNTALKHQIQDYGYCLRQQYEYVKFFTKVCGKELPEVHLIELLQICQGKVAENLEFHVSSLHIDPSQIDTGYYHKALSYLEQYPHSKSCAKLKAICYSGLAIIADIKVISKEL